MFLERNDMRMKQMVVRLERLESKLEAADKKSEELTKQINCAEDYGHEYVFDERIGIWFGSDCPVRHELFRYKCFRCGRIVHFNWDELTVKERNVFTAIEALKGK